MAGKGEVRGGKDSNLKNIDGRGKGIRTLDPRLGKAYIPTTLYNTPQQNPMVSFV